MLANDFDSILINLSLKICMSDKRRDRQFVNYCEKILPYAMGK